MRKAEERLRHYEKMAKEGPDTGKIPVTCRKCPFYQPDFMYRSCLYSRCPYDKTRTTLCSVPLKKDKIIKEAAKRDV